LTILEPHRKSPI